MARLPYDRNINPFVAYGAVLVIGALATDALLKAIALADAVPASPLGF
jgi:hypothetical protein